VLFRSRYAEDYIVKPVGDRELVARLRRVVRRSARNRREEAGCIPFVDQHLTISPGRREATLDGRVARLTPTECRILSYLAQRPNQTVPSEALLHECWVEGDGDPSQLWVHIRALRRKIEPDPDHPQYLLTRRGEGYSFARQPASPTPRIPVD
jgi:DNA-binding response OmpR family regulator